MGAATGIVDGPGAAWRRVHVAAGTYPLLRRTLVYGASLLGAGRETTVIEGSVAGPRTGAVLSGLTVTRGRRHGLFVGRGQAPLVTDCRFTENIGNGIYCAEDSSPEVRRSEITRGAEGEPATSSPGIRCKAGSTPVFTECVVSQNWGGGIVCMHSSPRIVNCEIWGEPAERCLRLQRIAPPCEHDGLRQLGICTLPE